LVFDEVQAELEAQGYEVTPFLLPACAVNAPHRRDRIWFVAYSKSSYNRGKCGWMAEKDAQEDREWDDHNKSKSSHIGDERYATDSDSIGQECRKERERSEGRSQSNDKLIKRRNKLPGADFQMFPTVSPICDGDDGLSDRLDGITFSKWRNESIKAGGNAIVPQVVHQIFKAIQQYNELDKQLTI